MGDTNMAKTTNARYVKMFRVSDFSMLESFAKDFGIDIDSATEIAEYVAENGKKPDLRIRRRNDGWCDLITVYYSARSYFDYTHHKTFCVRNGRIASRRG